MRLVLVIDVVGDRVVAYDRPILAPLSESARDALAPACEAISRARGGTNWWAVVAETAEDAQVLIAVPDFKSSRPVGEVVAKRLR